MKKLLIIAIISALSLCAAAQDTTAVSLQIGSGSKTTSLLVKDKVTGVTLQATITNVVIQNANPEIATVSFVNGSSVRVAPVATGSGTAVITCDVSYVDPGDGLQKNETKSIVVAYTVSAPPPMPHGAKLSLTFN